MKLDVVSLSTLHTKLSLKRSHCSALLLKFAAVHPEAALHISAQIMAELHRKLAEEDISLRTSKFSLVLYHWDLMRDSVPNTEGMIWSSIKSMIAIMIAHGLLAV